MPNATISPFDAWSTLNQIKQAVQDRASLIPVRGTLGLTKTERNETQATLLRDLDLEEEVQSWIEKRVGSPEILFDRYHRYDPRLSELSPPQHYPVRILQGMGSISSGKNIFLFFPECLGLPARDSSDVIGFEFIDIWTEHFVKAVYPCWLKVADPASQLRAATGLIPKLPKTISLASIYHEIGHRVGPYRVSPAQDPGLRIHTFHLDILGELATDILLGLHLREFPEILEFILMQRLFWFPRRGFSDNPVSARINEDNDSWIGAYLYSKLEKEGAISEISGRLQVTWDRTPSVFSHILREIDLLGESLMDRPPQEQDSLIRNWMERNVETTSEGRFVLPGGLRRSFQLCSTIPEIPHFIPLLPTTQEG